MTTPAPIRMQLPAPNFPMVTRVISSAMFPPEPLADGSLPPPRDPEPVSWMFMQPHPFVPSLRVVRMFMVPDGVAIYSAADGHAEGMRNIIPMHWVRFVEEMMPIEMFVEELALAEESDEPDDPNAPQGPPDPDQPADGPDGNSAFT
jgi:hypothetical protein